MTVESFHPALDKIGVRRSFNTSTETYDRASALQKYAGKQLLERLEMMKTNPLRILDLGSGPGLFSRELARMYARARIIQLDIADRMLMTSRRHDPRFFSRHSYVCADGEHLPLAPAAIDLVYSNLMLQWSQDPDRLFRELSAALRPDGLLVFATLGPDTLRELRDSWAAVDDQAHVHTFIDMHDLGDALIRAGFSDPVMEVEMVTLSYSNLSALVNDLKGLGASNINRDRRRTLTGKSRYLQMEAEYEKRRDNGMLPASYELIYGHAWLADDAGRAHHAESGQASISLEQIRQLLKKPRV
jgi:malonyl-CoA O-methyltransferase